MKHLQGCSMDEPSDKEVMRMFWITKGHLTSTIKTMRGMYNGYFKRAWCKYQGEDMSIWEEGFEEAYQERMKHPLEDHATTKCRGKGK